MTGKPTLEQLAAAMEASAGKTPQEVLDAFLPKKSEVAGVPLVPLTLGHEMILAQLGHPLSTGKPLDDSDVLTALFVFSRASREGFAMIADGSFDGEFFAWLESRPAESIRAMAPAVVAHWATARATALEMRSPHPSGSKKKQVLDGFSTRSQAFARRFGGVLTAFCMMFRFRRFSRSMPATRQPTG